MALGGILAGALTDHAAHPHALFVDQLDVILKPGSWPTRFGAPIEKIKVKNAGPNAISSMEFDVNDPGAEYTPLVGAEVRYHDFTLDQPIFLGYIQGWDAVNAYGVGRRYTIRAIGVEALLDWGVLGTDVTFTAGAFGSGGIPGTIPDAVLMLLRATLDLPPIWAAYAALGGTGSSLDHPISHNWAIGFGTIANDVTIKAGTSLRQAIATLASTLNSIATNPLRMAATIDAYYALRVWSEGVDVPSDYATLSVNNAVGSSTVARIQDTVDAAETIRGVFVRGAGSLFSIATDGSGRPGRWLVATDDTLTFQWNVDARARWLLATAAGTLRRGTVTREDRDPSASAWPGGTIIITDDRLGFAAQEFVIGQIDREYNRSGREDWTISYGGPAPSAIAALRRLTRQTN